MLALRRWTNETSNQFISQVNGLVSCPERSQGQSIAHKAPAAWFCCLLLLRWKPQIFRYFLFDCLALLEKKRAPPFFNFVFSSLLLCDVPWWCYTIMVWTQDNSWCYLVYFVGVALWCLHENPFSGYIFSGFYMDKKVWRTLYNTYNDTMHGGLLICKKTKWRFFTKEFLWLSLYTIV